MDLEQARWALGRGREVLRTEGVRATLKRAGNYSRGRTLSRLDMDKQVVAERTGCSVLMLAHETPEQCYRYRVLQKLEALRYAGIPAVRADPSDMSKARSLLGFSDLLIVYRVPASKALEAMVHDAKRQGIPVVYELDDAVYRRDLLASMDGLQTVPRSVRRSVLKGASLFLEALQMADHALASTPRLADDMGRHVPGVSYVLPNGADDRMWRIAEGSNRSIRPSRNESTWLVYASGTTTHDADLASIAEPLRELLAARRDVRLRLMGSLTLPAQLRGLGDQIVREEAMPYGPFLWRMGANDIILGPLTNDPFNTFKSPVKFIEANLMNRPFIGSPTVFGDYVDHGHTGFIATGSQQWLELLGQLIDNKERRMELANAGASYQQQFSTSRRLSEIASDVVSSLCKEPQ